MKILRNIFRFFQDSQRSLSRPQSAQGRFLRAHGNTGPENLRLQSASGSRRNSVDSTTSMTPDYVRMNAQYVKTIPKVRQSISKETIEQVREKRNKDLQSYHENQKGRVPD